METKRTTPLKAIRAKCLDCCCGNPYEVTHCPITSCALYIFRDGHNPFLDTSGWTEERKKAVTRNLPSRKPTGIASGDAEELAEG